MFGAFRHFGAAFLFSSQATVSSFGYFEIDFSLLFQFS
jgi:hypothetical protein